MVEQENCDNSNVGDNHGPFQLLFTCLGVISLVFLAITFIIYVTIPELGNTHGKIVLSNVVSAVMVTSYLLTVYNIQPGSSIMCSVLGYTVRGKVRDNNGISKLTLNAANFQRLNPLGVVQRSQHNPWKKFIVIISCY